jgi:MoaA/NifB/PqqE/SkfB family radical SAM enzyme
MVIIPEYAAFIKDTIKYFHSPNYNYSFDLKTGLFKRWGTSLADDPDFSPFGPEIADIEISEICYGVHGKHCPYCYKSNTSQGRTMPLDTFKKVIKAINRYNTLTQVAFGLGSTGEENPDLWKMCEYLRSNTIIPNGTVADITDETADKIAALFGAAAVSWHGDKNICYESVYKLTSRGLKQTNIHFVLCEETYNDALALIHDIKHDKRLEGMYALVFLSLKKKGRAVESHFNSLSGDVFKNLVDAALQNNINFGFDSCSFFKFEEAIKDNPKEKLLLTLAESCESTRFSVYVNVEGKFYPCSFCEGEAGWEKGVDIIDSDFVNAVWNGEASLGFRTTTLLNTTGCTMFAI